MLKIQKMNLMKNMDINMTNNGWVKLHRQLLDWEWYSDINVCRLFTHCLLKANHKPKKWKGIIIESGSFVGSRDILSAETGLTIQQIRTAIIKLKSTGELTIKTNNRFTLFSITCWDNYQDSNQQDNQQITNKQPTDNQQITTNKNDKNDKNKDIKVKINFDSWPNLISDELLQDWLKMRKRVKASCSQSAINNIGKQLHLAVLAGFTVEQCISEAETRSWKGFKSEWMKDETNQRSNNKSTAEKVSNRLDEIAAKDIRENGFTDSLDN